MGFDLYDSYRSHRWQDVQNLGQRRCLRLRLILSDAASFACVLQTVLMRVGVLQSHFGIEFVFLTDS